MKYEFMAEHHGQFRLSSMCRVLRIQRSGYSAWKIKPLIHQTLPMAELKQAYATMGSRGVQGKLVMVN